MKKIVIVGGGNVGTQLAVHCAKKGHDVMIYTPRYKEFKEILTIVDDRGQIIGQGRINKATDDAREAFEEADIIFVTVPANCMEAAANKMMPFISSKTMIGIIPGIGGSEFIFSTCKDKGACVFGLQRVPSVARLVTYGQSVCATGYRQELHLAAVNGGDTDICCEVVSDLLERPCVALPNYLNILLTPSNPILHPTRLFVLFSEYRQGVAYCRNPFFYKEWEDRSSELLLACDEEIQRICKRLKEFDLSYVKSLKSHYEVADKSALTDKLRSIKSLARVQAPVKKLDNKYIPDFSSRYFISDFPFGLAILIQIAEFVDLEVPNMHKVYDWFKGLGLGFDEFAFVKYNINSYEDFKAFYKGVR